MDAIRDKTADIPGILVEVTAPRAGPPTGKPVQVQIGALNPEVLPAVAKKVADMLAQRSEIRDLDDGLPLPGIDWKIDVDKAEAAKYAASPNTVGTAVQLVTNGVKVTEYRPAESDKAVDILVRFPNDRRSLDQIDELRVQTQSGQVPIGNFVQRVPAQRVGYINRVAGNRVITVSANVAEGVQSAKVQQEIAAELAKTDLGPGVTFRLKGEDEEREKAGAFLMKAFGTAMFLIFAILLAQFNRLTSVLLVLSAVILSTIGVLIGLMVMGQPFGVVMTGIGIIANAGVIVNNNIVLIDTYDRLRREGMAAYEAILETCRERARPVVLTAVTAILGVLPIAFGVNLDFILREVTVGAPATQWWISLSTAIVFGLGFATILTLIVTPAALMLIANAADWRVARMAKLRAWWRVGSRKVRARRRRHQGGCPVSAHRFTLRWDASSQRRFHRAPQFVRDMRAHAVERLEGRHRLMQQHAEPVDRGVAAFACGCEQWRLQRIVDDVRRPSPSSAARRARCRAADSRPCPGSWC